jgi:hypothetical protein
MYDADRWMYDADRWIELDPGESSMVTAIGTKDGWLLVKFHKGEVYRYRNADRHMDEMLAAESVGKYFVEEVKPIGGQRLGSEWPST